MTRMLYDVPSNNNRCWQWHQLIYADEHAVFITKELTYVIFDWTIMSLHCFAMQCGNFWGCIIWNNKYAYICRDAEVSGIWMKHTGARTTMQRAVLQRHAGCGKSPSYFLSAFILAWVQKAVITGECHFSLACSAHMLQPALRPVLNKGSCNMYLYGEVNAEPPNKYST